MNAALREIIEERKVTVLKEGIDPDIILEYISLSMVMNPYFKVLIASPNFLKISMSIGEITKICTCEFISYKYKP